MVPITMKNVRVLKQLNKDSKRRPNLRKFSDLISVQQQFLQCPSIARYFRGHNVEVAMSLIDVIYVTITTLPERYALHHG